MDDVFAKSRKEEDHVQVLKKLLERLRKFQLKLNHAKCSFGVKTGKMLDFIVSSQGIEIDQDKVKEIHDIPTFKIEKELRSFILLVKISVTRLVLPMKAQSCTGV
jgi:predicted MPP superfamily phosphohydrolase